ncbi:hypothetical protein [Aestuariimicrobium ganziense]|uniref:hypothetical protein n=1 Tax=Aestuariimicrobium ganziense TaxID=2773677 RepID=UPI0019420C67|nr:hypothetical protein [Aestuariimicrobium ganziense]
MVAAIVGADELEVLPARTDLGVDEVPRWKFTSIDPRTKRRQSLGWMATLLLVAVAALAAGAAAPLGPTFVKVEPMRAAPPGVDPRALPLLLARDSGSSSALGNGTVTAPELAVGTFGVVPSVKGQACYWERREPRDGRLVRATSGWVTTYAEIVIEAPDQVLHSSGCWWSLVR